MHVLLQCDFCTDRDVEREKLSKAFWAPCKNGPLVPLVSAAYLGQA